MDLTLTAYETLKEIGQHENDACVGCHVVAYDKQGGFISEKYTPHLKGVGVNHVMDQEKSMQQIL